MSDLISREEACLALDRIKIDFKHETFYSFYQKALMALHDLPSAQPEHICVNCGRTVNNGGWYEDGRTRCPIEEHYALPKDGYCHLWEKRKVWEDGYVKRPEEGEK